MRHPDITHLYKYRAFSVHSLSILKTSKVWFAKPVSFNDPFDCQTPFSYSLTPNEAIVYGLRMGIPKDKIEAILTSRGKIHKGFMQNWIETLEKTDKDLKKIGVFTLSELSSNVLLWAHYADCHKGFCIEFVRSPDNQLGDYDITRRVQYRRDYPSVSPINKKAYDLKFFTKASDWKYEREWRLINDEGDVEESLHNVQMSAVIFGLRMPELHKEEIRKITSYLPHIKYRQAIKVPDRFELRIEDV